MALTKAEMAEHLFEELGLNKREAKDMVEMFFEEIRGALENGQQVKLSGFGNFDSPQNAFIDGRVSMEVQGVWFSNFIRRHRPHLEFGVAPPPAGRRLR